MKKPDMTVREAADRAEFYLHMSYFLNAMSRELAKKYKRKRGEAAAPMPFGLDGAPRQDSLAAVLHEVDQLATVARGRAEALLNGTVTTSSDTGARGLLGAGWE